MRSISAEGSGETECYYPGRGERRTITTQGGARDGLLLSREGWEVVVIVNTTAQAIIIL